VNTVLTKFAAALDKADQRQARTTRYDFRDYLYAVQPPERYPERLPAPVEALFTLTNKCNLRCIYCYNDSGLSKGDELTTAEWLKLVAQACEIGVQKIHLSGGEPFAHRGAVDILRELRRRDLLIEVATNGARRYSPEVLRLLAGARVDISLDTADDAIYTALTGHRALSQVVANIGLFVRAGASVSIKVCVTNLNYHKIGDLYRLLADLGVADVGLAAYTTSPSGRGGDSLSLTDEMIAYVQSEFEAIDQVPATPLTFGLPHPCWTVKEDIISCDGMANTIIVMPNGDVTPCELLTGTSPLCFGNVRRTPLLDIWNGSLVSDFFYRKSHPTDSVCGGCGFAQTCRTGCFAEKAYRRSPLYGPDPRCRLH
jgi:radical SAM protein with 4Fe4S-binding SPASM domain